MRVMRSLIGSCVDISDLLYQLDFTSPGTRPLEPSSRSAMRLSLFLRYTERGRPVISQRLRIRVADELRGISASFKVAANRSSIGLDLSAMMAFSFARFGAAFLVIRLRRSFFSIELFFAMLGSWVSAFERLKSASHCRNGKLNAVNNALASSSERAVVHTVTSMPHVSPILSKSISGKMMCSLMPSE